jgi:hypothetical protein
MARAGSIIGALFVVAGVVTGGGCGGNPSSDPGLDLLLRVGKSQFYRGAMPAESGGPSMHQLNASTSVRPGQNDGSVGGLVDKETTGIILGLDGDRGYWLIQPGNSDPLSDFDLTFSAPIQFSALIPNGSYTMVGHAVDISGRVGPPITLTVRVADAGVPTLPATLLVSLRWDTETDLDLHLELPDGTEIFSQKVSSFSGNATEDPTGYLAGGQLDADSNASCIIDGRRVENIYWTQPPPSGHYIARVETYSLCSDFAAVWQLGVTSNDEQLGVVHGYSRDTDTLAHRGKGAGLTAIEFDIP